MALSNHERVGKALDVLKPALASEWSHPAVAWYNHAV